MAFVCIPGGTRSRDARWRFLAALLPAAWLAACGGGDSTGPNGNGNGPVVASVELAGPTGSIEVGETFQLTATAKDGAGNVVTGKTFTWTSTNQAVATVSAQGAVIGQTAGSATINATVDGKSGGYPVTVIPPTIPSISAISPNPLVAGQSATITGTNFSVTPSNNLVTLGGSPVTVTGASATSLTVSVPATLCVPGSAEVKVTVNGRASNVIQQPAQLRGEVVNVALGKQVIYSAPTDPCFQFPATVASEAYLIGVQSTSESVSSLTNLSIGLAAAGSAGPVLATAQQSAPLSAGPTVAAARALRWRRHREAEMELRARERAQIAPMLAQMVRSRPPSPSFDAATAIPANIQVGETVPVRVPNRNGNLCQDFVEIQATAKAIGTRSVWLEDNGNPAGGFTTSEYQTLADQFDNTIYATDTNYFGSPSDVDDNSRIIIVVTKEVNKVGGILGFTSTSDLIQRAQCASSDFGEIYYAIAIDAAGTLGGVYTKAEALDDSPLLLAHELTHLIQFAVRIALGTSNIQRVWELEGQATLAEEINGHVFANRTPRNNYGFEIAFNCSDPPGCNTGPDPIDWYIGAFVDVILYYGFESPTVRASGAPEACSWLDLSTNGNTGPCQSGREVYGVPWSILRYISDQYHTQFPGGEAELHRRLVSGTTQGFANIERVVGVPMSTILARWAASLWVDDRVAGADPSITFPSWNLKEIADRLVTTAQLVPRERSFGGFSDQAGVRAGSSAYFRVSGAGRPAGALRVRTPAGALPPGIIQVWIVRVQ